MNKPNRTSKQKMGYRQRDRYPRLSFKQPVYHQPFFKKKRNKLKSPYFLGKLLGLEVRKETMDIPKRVIIGPDAHMVEKLTITHVKVKGGVVIYAND